MIAYFDTSALLPLIVDEASTALCQRLWNEASRIVSIRLVYAEAAAALAMAHQVGHITALQFDEAITVLEAITAQLVHVEITDELFRTAVGLARTHGLRGYDAVHLAAGTKVSDDDFVFVTGDSKLARVAQLVGLAVANTNS